MIKFSLRRWRTLSLSVATAMASMMGMAWAQEAATPAAAAVAGKNADVAMGGVEISADDYAYHPDTGQATGRGHVKIVYRDVEITADSLDGNMQTKLIVARGNVTLKRGTFSWKGEEVSGNIDTKDFKVGPYTATSDALYMKGDSGVHSGKTGKTVMKKARITTCDQVDHPHYCLRTTSMTHYSDGQFTARNVVFMIGSVPVFYLPIVWGDATPGEGGLEIEGGYSGKYGVFLKLGKTWKLSTGVDTKMMLDMYSKHGIGVGNKTRIKTESTYTETLLYGMADTNSPETEPGFNRRFASEDTRYRARVYHRHSFMEDEELNLRLKVDKLSDIDMLEDWFKKEYRTDPQPKSFADITLDSDRFSLSLAARPHWNEFYSEVEQLPSLRLQMPRQQLSTSGFYYQSDSSASKMDMRWRKFDSTRTLIDPSTKAALFDPADPTKTPLSDPTNYSATRVDSLHMFYYPIKIADDFELVPRAGARMTWYDKSSDKPVTVKDLEKMMLQDDPNAVRTSYNQGDLSAFNPYDNNGGEVLRLAAETGFELSTKYYSTWSEYQSRRWDLDGLRHVLQPYVNYTYEDTNQSRDKLYFFDDVDRLIEQNFVRLGLRQRWQTRRSNHIYTLATLENYEDFHFTPQDGHDNLGNFGTKFTFRPKPTFSITGNALVDSSSGDLNRAELITSIGDKRVCQVDFSYLYRNKYESATLAAMGASLTDIAGDGVFERAYEKSHYATVQFNFPIFWQMDAIIRYEYDVLASKLALQSYEVQRDLHCWRGGLRLESNEDTVAIMLMLYLKAFPGFGVKAGQ